MEKKTYSELQGIVYGTAEKDDNGEPVSTGQALNVDLGKLPAALRKVWGWKKASGSAADDLTQLGQDMADELFKDQFSQPHALIAGRSVPISSMAPMLRARWFHTQGKAASSEAINNAVGTLAALAEVEGQEYELKTRWARIGDVIYYETAPGKVYKINAAGWQLEPNPPVRFRDVPNLKALPDPERGGTISDLEELIKLEGRDFRLFVSLMVSYPFEDIPRPILAMIGLKGRGKTTRSLIPKRLMDEDSTDFVKPNEDILRKATHRGIVACDNQSVLPKGVADLMCGLVTGTGDSNRQLYTDNSEYGFKVQCPLILNGINLASEQADLLDRSVVIEAPAISATERFTESEFWAKFERERGKLLGVIFDLVSGVLKHRAPLVEKPRMADWAEITSAMYEYAGWGREQFRQDWQVVERGQNESALEGSPAAQAILNYLDAKTSYEGTAAELLGKLTDYDETLKRNRAFPKTANMLSRRLNEITDALVARGIKVERINFGKGKSQRKLIRLFVDKSAESADKEKISTDQDWV